MLKLTFEVGHKAVRKPKVTREGFTHDWEMFIRGVNDTDISHFVDKVVFNLHESFQKPKRVCKEQPYSIKESGYAGFMLKCEIHLNNRDEPKKLELEYDLDLSPIKTIFKEFNIPSPNDDFRKKCLKGGGQMISDYKARDPYSKPSTSSSDVKKSSKRPDEVKPNDKFHELFGQPLNPRAHQNSSPIPSKSSSGKDKSSMSSSSKDKIEKSKHKHSPGKDGNKDMKKSSQETSSEKVKKDKTKDRERSETKKDKSSKRPSSPSPSSMSSSSARNSTTQNSSSSKSDSKSKIKSTPPISTSSDAGFVKKSNKKDKKSDRDRERSDKKDQRKFESPPKGRDGSSSSIIKDDKKVKTSPQEPKMNLSNEVDKRSHEKDSERKHKHKKKEKSKDKDAERDKKDKISKNPNAAYQSKLKEIATKPQTPISEIESDVESPPSIKQDSENSNSDPVPQKTQTIDVKKSEKRSKTDKEEKSKKRKATKDLSVSPPPAKNTKLDEKSNESMNNNNNLEENGLKMSNEYISELKDLRQKINGLNNKDDLQHVVKIIASTGCYEVTKSTFDFDLIQLDRTTIQSLLEMFKIKK